MQLLANVARALKMFFSQRCGNVLTTNEKQQTNKNMEGPCAADAYMRPLHSSFLDKISSYRAEQLICITDNFCFIVNDHLFRSEKKK